MTPWMLKLSASPLCQTCKLRLEYTGGELADIRIGGEGVTVSCHPQDLLHGKHTRTLVFFCLLILLSERGVCWIGV